MPFTGFDTSLYTASVVVRDPEEATDAPYDALIYEPTITFSNIVTDGFGVVTSIDINVSIKNISANKVRWPRLVFNIGWSHKVLGVDYQDNLWRYWTCRHKFQVAQYPNTSGGGYTADQRYFLGAQISWFLGSGSPSARISAPLACWDNYDPYSLEAATDTIGISTDYPYMIYMVPKRPSYGNTHNVEIRPTTWSGSQKRIIPDFFSPGETKSINIWLRNTKTNPGTEEAAISCLQPYINYMQENYPLDPPPIPRRRTLGIFIGGAADAGKDLYNGITNPRGREYWAWGGVRPYDFSGWYDLLDACTGQDLTDLYPDIRNYGGADYIKSNDYDSILLWLASGHYVGSADNFFPSVFSNLPENLRNTVDEVPQWIQDRGLKVYLWFGHGLARIQRGDWKSDNELVLSDGMYQVKSGSEKTQLLKLDIGDHLESGYLATTISMNDAQTWTLRPEALADFESNVFECLKYFSGIGLDAMREPCQDYWVLDILKQMRQRFPDKWFAAEGHKTHLVEHRARNYFFRGSGNVSDYTGVDQYGFDGICPLLNTIYPGYKSTVHVQYAEDINQETNIQNDLDLVETSGMHPVIISKVMTSAWQGPDYDYDPPTNVYASQITKTSALITWTATVSPGVSRYFVKYSTTLGGPYGNTTEHTGTSALITGLTTGMTYNFVVSSFADEGVESDYSNEAKVKIRSPGSPNTRSVILYERISNLYSSTLDALSSRDSELYDAVNEIVRSTPKSADVKVDLLRDFHFTYDESVKQSETTLLNSVRKINQHVLRRGNFSSLDEYLEEEGILVSQEWADICNKVGFPISSIYIS